MAASRVSASIDLDAPGRHVGDLRLKWSDNSVPLGYYAAPVISLKGANGPTALLIGGTHGDEFEGPAALMRLANALDPQTLNGQIIMLPAFNGPAVSASARVSPLDGANLNRAFPGDPDGGPTAMLADYLEAHLMPRASAVVDLHSGGKASFFLPCTLATHCADPQLYAANLDLARAFGLPLIWRLGAHNDNRSVNAAAERQGIPMIAAELGGGGGIDPDITNLTEKGLRNILAHMGILPGSVEKTEPRLVEIASPGASLYATGRGLFDRYARAGDPSVAGEAAGQFHYIFEPERPSVRINYPEDGLILAHTCRGLVERGDLLYLIAQDVRA